MMFRYRIGIAGTERLADRYPDQFAGLDLDEALDLYFTARALTSDDDEIDEAVLGEARCRNVAEAEAFEDGVFFG
jgi:hypothetical protein